MNGHVTSDVIEVPGGVTPVSAACLRIHRGPTTGIRPRTRIPITGLSAITSADRCRQGLDLGHFLLGRHRVRSPRHHPLGRHRVRSPRHHPLGRQTAIRPDRHSGPISRGHVAPPCLAPPTAAHIRLRHPHGTAGPGAIHTRARPPTHTSARTRTGTATTSRGTRIPGLPRTRTTNLCRIPIAVVRIRIRTFLETTAPDSLVHTGCGNLKVTFRTPMRRTDHGRRRRCLGRCLGSLPEPGTPGPLIRTGSPRAATGRRSRWIPATSRWVPCRRARPRSPALCP